MRLLIAVLLFAATLNATTLDISVNAEEAVLMNALTGQILYEKNKDQLAYPASTTKIATALWVLHRYREHLDKVLTAERESVASITPQAKRQSNYRSPPIGLKPMGRMSASNGGKSSVCMIFYTRFSSPLLTTRQTLSRKD